MSYTSKPKFISFTCMLIPIMVAKFFIVRSPDPVVPNIEIFQKHPFCKAILDNFYGLIAFHVSGIYIAYLSVYILQCALFPAFLLLLARFLLFAPYVDFVFGFTSFGFFIVALTTKLNQSYKYRQLSPFFIALSGIYSAFCVNIAVEFISIGLFSFFAILFFWLKAHRIGNDDGSAAPDAIATVGIFMLSFGGSFFLFGSLFGYPQYSQTFWRFRDTIKILPILSSRLALSSIPAFMSNLEPSKRLLCATAIISAEFFRFIPLASNPAVYSTTDGSINTENFNDLFNVITLVSAGLFDIASLVFITGVSTRFVGLFSTAIYVSTTIILRFVFCW
ncbi:hypothetical protein TRFO_28604 [Tritrichomonas foetus]|uniref:Uncharacterized protein n=1 Tax=Tritrichomonas foetus TaxID=1144522 RepID=A0A1J4JYD5_9EUKA|nr:hypothetical protein TRFO_28604 [Tritrichomonas foetus]|eukprot:OHT04003.1 hypothetical protein TRFO_28604 [Tritrichomonas foetus]